MRTFLTEFAYIWNSFCEFKVYYCFSRMTKLAYSRLLTQLSSFPSDTFTIFRNIVLEWTIKSWKFMHWAINGTQRWAKSKLISSTQLEGVLLNWRTNKRETRCLQGRLKKLSSFFRAKMDPTPCTITKGPIKVQVDSWTDVLNYKINYCIKKMRGGELNTITSSCKCFSRTFLVKL